MRLPDWQSRLAAVIKARQQDRFEWGRNDCCLFVCDCVQAIVGIDPGATFRGLYDDRETGYKFIRVQLDDPNATVATIAARICQTMGFVEIAPALAQRGDVGLYRGAAGETLGICLGGHWAFLLETGMTYLSTAEIARVWRV